MHLDGGEEGNSETYFVYRFSNMRMYKKGKLNEEFSYQTITLIMCAKLG